MYKGLKNRKGFTLIELLAAIVILGVLMMVAIPAMTRYIANSKKDVFMNTAKQYISSVRYAILSDGFMCGKVDENGVIDKETTAVCGMSDLTDSTKHIIIPANLVELDTSSSTNSPWGKPFAKDETTNKAWIMVTNTGGSETPKYEYQFIGTDSAGNGIQSVISEGSITRSSVKTTGKTAELTTLTKGSGDVSGYCADGCLYATSYN